MSSAPKGLSVRLRVLRISSRIRWAVSFMSRVMVVWPALGPRMPKPPALDTAATSFASVSQFMGA